MARNFKLGAQQCLLGPPAFGNVADVALDDFASAFIVEIADELDFAALAPFVLQRQVLVANEMLLLQLAKSQLVGFFILEQADFPKFLAEQFAARVTQ